MRKRIKPKVGVSLQPLLLVALMARLIHAALDETCSLVCPDLSGIDDVTYGSGGKTHTFYKDDMISTGNCGDATNVIGVITSANSSLISISKDTVSEVTVNGIYDFSEGNLIPKFHSFYYYLPQAGGVTYEGSTGVAAVL